MKVFTCTLWIQARPSNLSLKSCRHPLKFQLNSACVCDLAEVHVKQLSPALQNTLTMESLSACSLSGPSSSGAVPQKGRMNHSQLHRFLGGIPVLVVLQKGWQPGRKKERLRCYMTGTHRTSQRLWTAALKSNLWCYSQSAQRLYRTVQSKADWEFYCLPSP